jgi:hypothetical protein
VRQSPDIPVATTQLEHEPHAPVYTDRLCLQIVGQCAKDITEAHSRIVLLIDDNCDTAIGPLLVSVSPRAPYSSTVDS